MYRLYVKWPGQKQYKPVDWRKGLQVGNLIYATLFTAEEKQRLELELSATMSQNPGMVWEWREVDGTRS